MSPGADPGLPRSSTRTTHCHSATPSPLGELIVPPDKQLRSNLIIFLISTFNPSYVRCHCIVSVCMRNFLCLLSKSSLILTWYFRNAAASVLLSSMLYPPKIWSLPKDYQLTIRSTTSEDNFKSCIQTVETTCLNVLLAKILNLEKCNGSLQLI